MTKLTIGSVAAILASAFLAMPVTAQETGNGSGPPAVDPICEVFFAGDDGEATVQRETSAEPGLVVAVCGELGYQLGELDGFLAVVHRDSGAVAVQTIRGSDKRVWLFSQNEDGSVLLEDLTPEFSRAVGRAVTSNLDDVRLNFARFRATGVISAVPSGREGARPAAAAEISLDQRLARSGAGSTGATEGVE